MNYKVIASIMCPNVTGKDAIVKELFENIPKYKKQLVDNTFIPWTSFNGLRYRMWSEIQKYEPQVVQESLQSKDAVELIVNIAGGLDFPIPLPMRDDKKCYFLAMEWVKNSGFSEKFKPEIMATKDLTLEVWALTLLLRL